MLEDDTKAITTAACNNWPPRICHTCHAAACMVFCRVDSAYLCTQCNTRVHAANHMDSWHERVRVCEACQHAPAAFPCKADAASLCSSCVAYIHSANSLGSRHHHVPILPISGFLHGHPATTFQDNGFVSGHDCGGEIEVDKEDEGVDVEDENEAASWLLLNPVKKNSSNNTNEQSNGFMFDGEVHQYLDQVDCNSCGDNYRQQNQHQHQHQQQGQNFQLGLDFDQFSKAGFSYNGSISQSVSVSSIDVGIVPESTMRDVSFSHPSPPKGTIDLFYGPPIHMPCHLTPMDREARVLRYREKKKTRKFEKTIRYASRKAYAETRPRVKGRFAKRTDVGAEVDQMFSSSLITDVEYGIVPSL